MRRARFGGFKQNSFIWVTFVARTRGKRMLRATLSLPFRRTTLALQTRSPRVRAHRRVRSGSFWRSDCRAMPAASVTLAVGWGGLKPYALGVLSLKGTRLRNERLLRVSRLFPRNWRRNSERALPKRSGMWGPSGSNFL